MRGPARQAGLSYFGWLVVIAFVGILVVAGLRLTPIYLEFFKVNTALKEVAAEAGISKKSKRYVWNNLQRRFSIDDVESVSMDDLVIEVVDGGAVTFHINYERRTKLIGNIDAVVTFELSQKANSTE